MDEMRAQAERFGAELVSDDVIAVDLTGEIKVVTTAEGTVHRARAVILAMGSGYRKLGLPDEDRLSGHGVSWCATCDGFFFREQHIAVVGGGDSAHRGGDVPVPLRLQGHPDPPPRRAARLQDHAGARLRRPEDRVRLELRGRRDPRRRQAHRRSPCATPSPARPASSTRPACSSRSATTRARSCSRGQVDLDDEGYVLVDAPLDPHQPRRASSPAATWSTTTTGRRSPPPAPAAPPRSTPSATSRPSTTPPRPRRSGGPDRRRGRRRAELTAHGSASDGSPPEEMSAAPCSLDRPRVSTHRRSTHGRPAGRHRRQTSRPRS